MIIIIVLSYFSDDNPRDDSPGIEPSLSCDLRYAGGPSNNTVTDWKKGYAVNG